MSSKLRLTLNDSSYLLKALAQTLENKVDQRRVLIAVAGAPASGKSTLAAQLVADWNVHAPRHLQASVIPMDGFHLDNRLLRTRKLLRRKGSPETFDLNGFQRLIPALKQQKTVVFPLFDRRLDLAIAGAGSIDQNCAIAVIEGNYLLLDRPKWRELSLHWDLSIQLDILPNVIEKRIITRWLQHGLSPDQAERRYQSNDLPNAQLIINHMLPSDIILKDQP